MSAIVCIYFIHISAFGSWRPFANYLYVYLWFKRAVLCKIERWYAFFCRILLFFFGCFSVTMVEGSWAIIKVKKNMNIRLRKYARIKFLGGRIRMLFFFASLNLNIIFLFARRVKKNKNCKKKITSQSRYFNEIREYHFICIVCTVETWTQFHGGRRVGDEQQKKPIS